MVRKDRKHVAFELMTVDDATRVRERLDKNRLSQKWLLFRLDRDWGIQVRKSQLSEILDGKRALGPKTQRLIWCCHRVIEDYESFYKGR